LLTNTEKSCSDITIIVTKTITAQQRSMIKSLASSSRMHCVVVSRTPRWIALAVKFLLSSGHIIVPCLLSLV